MGQYFHPICLAKNKKTVLKWVSPHKFDNGLKLMEHSYIGNHFVMAFETLISGNPQHVVWCGDYADKDNGKNNAYDRCTDKNEVTPFIPKQTGRYVVNHTKNTYVDKTKLPKVEWQIHPLPLLTCNSNQRGGGDYFGKASAKLVGTWARDLISIESEKPKGFKELKVKFTEIE